MLGAIYLVGIPAIFGSNPTIQFLTSGLGLLAFILYLPGGLAELLHRLGDVVTLGIEQLTRRRGTPRSRASTDPLLGAGGHRGGGVTGPDERRLPAGPARLDLEGVSVAFGGVQAVDGADLSADPGAIVGLIGPNGSGKTTLLDVISGLVTPQAGSVRLDGESLVEYLPEERSALGLVRSFQDCRLFPELSVEEVLWLTQDAGPAGGRAVLHAPHALGACGPNGPSALPSTR